MQQLGMVTNIRGDICTVEFMTSVGCCGGKRTKDGSSCCGGEKGNTRLLSLKAYKDIYSPRVGDEVLVKSSPLIVWFQGFMALILPSLLALVSYHIMGASFIISFLYFPIFWALLAFFRFVFPKLSLPLIKEVNPSLFIPTSFKKGN